MDAIEQIIDEELTRSIEAVYQSQRNVARMMIYGRTTDRLKKVKRSMALQNALDNPQTSIHVSGQWAQAIMSWPIYLRFLDMKDKQNLEIYNRVVWGEIYHSTLSRLRERISEVIGSATKN